MFLPFLQDYYSCHNNKFYWREETLSDETFYFIFFKYYYFITAGHSVLCLSVRQDRQQGPLTRFTVCFPESKRAVCNKLLHTLSLTRQQTAVFLIWIRNGETSQTERVSVLSKKQIMILTSPCSRTKPPSPLFRPQHKDNLRHYGPVK